MPASALTQYAHAFMAPRVVNERATPYRYDHAQQNGQMLDSHDVRSYLTSASASSPSRLGGGDAAVGVLIL